jgi:Ferritin-like domain
MSSSIAEFDQDGAVSETAQRAFGGELDDERVGQSRSSFFKHAGAGAALVMGGGALAGTLSALARGATLPQSDVDILNFALTLEYLEADFYAQAKASGALKGETLRFARVVSSHEKSHVEFLKKVLGARAIAKPRFDFKGTTGDMAKFLATADVLENTGVHAYLGQVPNIKTPAVLVGAGRILPVEARHAAWIRDIRFDGGPTSMNTPAPGAFEEGFSKAKILSLVTGTGFIVG